MPDPLVSVCLPDDNAEACRSAALENTLVRTCPDVEIICIDDGSIDDAPRYGTRALKQSVTSLAGLIAEYDQVRDALADTPYAWFLDGATKALRAT